MTKNIALKYPFFLKISKNAIISFISFIYIDILLKSLLYLEIKHLKINHTLIVYNEVACALARYMILAI